VVPSPLSKSIPSSSSISSDFFSLPHSLVWWVSSLPPFECFILMIFGLLSSGCRYESGFLVFYQIPPILFYRYSLKLHFHSPLLRASVYCLIMLSFSSSLEEGHKFPRIFYLFPQDEVRIHPLTGFVPYWDQSLP
jgi:hypothetical protein